MERTLLSELYSNPHATGNALTHSYMRVKPSGPISFQRFLVLELTQEQLSIWNSGSNIQSITCPEHPTTQAGVARLLGHVSTLLAAGSQSLVFPQGTKVGGRAPSGSVDMASWLQPGVSRKKSRVGFLGSCGSS